MSSNVNIQIAVSAHDDGKVYVNWGDPYDNVSRNLPVTSNDHNIT